MSNEPTGTSNDNNSFEPFSLEKFKEVLEGLKSLRIEPRKCFYTDSITYSKILDGMMRDKNYMVYLPLGAIDLIVDNNIDPGQIVFCEPGLYDIWKSLKVSQWIDQHDKTLDLWKAADTLFQYQQKLKDEILNGVTIDFNPNHLRGKSPLDSIFERFNTKK
jgi:hypothetical protein